MRSSIHASAWAAVDFASNIQSRSLAHCGLCPPVVQVADAHHRSPRTPFVVNAIDPHPSENIGRSKHDCVATPAFVLQPCGSMINHQPRGVLLVSRLLAPKLSLYVHVAADRREGAWLPLRYGFDLAAPDIKLRIQFGCRAGNREKCEYSIQSSSVGHHIKAKK